MLVTTPSSGANPVTEETPTLHADVHTATASGSTRVRRVAAGYTLARAHDDGRPRVGSAVSVVPVGNRCC